MYKSFGRLSKRSTSLVSADKVFPRTQRPNRVPPVTVLLGPRYCTGTMQYTKLNATCHSHVQCSAKYARSQPLLLTWRKRPERQAERDQVHYWIASPSSDTQRCALTNYRRAGSKKTASSKNKYDLDVKRTYHSEENGWGVSKLLYRTRTSPSRQDSSFQDMFSSRNVLMAMEWSPLLIPRICTRKKARIVSLPPVPQCQMAFIKQDEIIQNVTLLSCLELSSAANQV